MLLKYLIYYYNFIFIIITYVYSFLKLNDFFSETKLGSGSGNDESVVGEGFLSNAATTQCGFSLGGEKV